ncbi:GAF domain-containing protein [Celeribacter ethanolicus]|uniref:GAF domain-containing protein n=1 Tax=Celeribacter ethanolicus TaxID=1758178 RepID=UPI00082E8200|nr:GAF domain-containing protein [Celeribacter ethanolicus]
MLDCRKMKAFRNRPDVMAMAQTRCEVLFGFRDEAIFPMFDSGDPQVREIAFSLHAQIAPSGVLAFRALPTASGTQLEVLANTDHPVGRQLERVLMPENTIGHLVVDLAREIVSDDTLVHPLIKDTGAVSVMGIMAYIGVPCRFRGQVFGGISAVDSHRRHWSHEEVQFVRDSARALECLAKARHGGL